MLKAREDAGAGGFGGDWVQVGSAAFRRLGQGDEQSGFGGGQAARFLAEVAQRRGAQSLDVAAIGGEGQVEREDFGFAVLAFQCEGDADLAEFA
jgi:hypothetical protein